MRVSVKPLHPFILPCTLISPQHLSVLHAPGEHADCRLSSLLSFVSLETLMATRISYKVPEDSRPGGVHCKGRIALNVTLRSNASHNRNVFLLQKTALVNSKWIKSHTSNNYFTGNLPGGCPSLLWVCDAFLVGKCLNCISTSLTSPCSICLGTYTS